LHTCKGSQKYCAEFYVCLSICKHLELEEGAAYIIIIGSDVSVAIF
jgi:hypothetical protein